MGNIKIGDNVGYTKEAKEALSSLDVQKTGVVTNILVVYKSKNGKENTTNIQWLKKIRLPKSNSSKITKYLDGLGKEERSKILKKYLK